MSKEVPTNENDQPAVPQLRVLLSGKEAQDFLRERAEGIVDRALARLKKEGKLKKGQSSSRLSLQDALKPSMN